MANNNLLFQSVQCRAPMFGGWQNTHPAAGKAWLKLVRVVMRVEGTSSVELLHGEMSMVVLVARAGGCRDHHPSFMGGGQLSPWCGAVGAVRAVCPFRACISCELVP